MSERHPITTTSIKQRIIRRVAPAFVVCIEEISVTAVTVGLSVLLVFLIKILINNLVGIVE